MKRLLPLLFLVLCTCLPGEFAAGAKTANTIANGVACGMAAANGTPCTPQAVLDALARDAAAQKTKVEAVAPQAAATDPEQTAAILAALERSAATNEALTKALLVLATRQAPEPAPLPDKAPRDEPADAGAPDAADGGL